MKERGKRLAKTNQNPGGDTFLPEQAETTSNIIQPYE